VYSFFPGELDAASERLRNFMPKAAQGHIGWRSVSMMLPPARTVELFPARHELRAITAENAAADRDDSCGISQRFVCEVLDGRKK